MCEICMKTPCDSRCPNASEPPIAFYCVACHKPIYQYDEYYELEGDAYCYECIDSCRREAEIDEAY